MFSLSTFAITVRVRVRVRARARARVIPPAEDNVVAVTLCYCADSMPEEPVFCSLIPTALIIARQCSYFINKGATCQPLAFTVCASFLYFEC